MAEDHQIQSSSSYIDNFKPSNNGTKYKDKREIKKLSQEEKN
jgi:hypothetical protein